MGVICRAKTDPSILAIQRVALVVYPSWWQGQTLRANSQIIFTFADETASDLELIDYH